MEETFTLNNGVKMPEIGLGTFRMSSSAAQGAVEAALADGYHLIDTAEAYYNEDGVGRGIKNSGINREDLFISTKLWTSSYNDPDAVDKALDRLGLDYIDLLFLHQPTGDWKTAYRTLEKAYADGKIKAIGISNFDRSASLLKSAMDFAEVKPQVLQAEAHPYFPQTEAREILKPYGTRLMAWYPLGSVIAAWSMNQSLPSWRRSITSPTFKSFCVGTPKWASLWSLVLPTQNTSMTTMISLTLS